MQNLSGIDPRLVFECVVDTATATGTSVEAVLDALQVPYPEIRTIYTGFLASISRLPDETALDILGHSSIQQLSVLGQIDRRLFELTRDPVLWRRKLQQDWGVSYPDLDTFAEYGRLYAQYIPRNDILLLVQDIKRLMLRLVPDSPALREFRYAVAEADTITYDTYDPVNSSITQTTSELELLPLTLFTRVSIRFLSDAGEWCGEVDAVEYWGETYGDLLCTEFYASHSPSKYIVEVDQTTDYTPSIIVNVYIRKPKQQAQTFSIPATMVPEIASNLKRALLESIPFTEAGHALQQLVQDSRFYSLHSSYSPTRHRNIVGVYAEGEGVRVARYEPVQEMRLIVPYRTVLAKRNGACTPSTGPVFASMQAPLGMLRTAFESKVDTRLRRKYRSYSKKDGIDWEVRCSLSQDPYGILGVCIVLTIGLHRSV